MVEERKVVEERKFADELRPLEDLRLVEERKGEGGDAVRKAEAGSVNDAFRGRVPDVRKGGTWVEEVRSSEGVMVVEERGVGCVEANLTDARGDEAWDEEKVVVVIVVETRNDLKEVRGEVRGGGDEDEYSIVRVVEDV